MLHRSVQLEDLRVCHSNTVPPKTSGDVWLVSVAKYQRVVPLKNNWQTNQVT